jgi:hypothetical protein
MTTDLLKHAVRSALPQGTVPADLFVKPVPYGWYDKNASADTTGDAIVLLAMLLLHRDDKRISMQTRYPTVPNNLRELFGKVVAYLKLPCRAVHLQLVIDRQYPPHWQRAGDGVPTDANSVPAARVHRQHSSTRPKGGS